MTIAEPDAHTIPEKLLLAAFDVQQKRSPWPIEQLIVTAWKRWPDTFGLRWYKETYPNANIIISAMSGAKGLVGRGCFERIHANIYQLTSTGQECVKLLAKGGGNLKKKNAYSKATDAAKGKEELSLIAALQDTVAYGKDCAGNRSGINWLMAERFFNGYDRMELLRKLRSIGESDELGAAAARVLYGLADHLIERFGRQWAIHDERGKR